MAKPPGSQEARQFRVKGIGFRVQGVQGIVFRV